jgi:hypothetical protein
MDEIWEVAESRGANSEAPHLWEGLVGAWPMQEGGGTKVFDSSGNYKHGTLTNTTPDASWSLSPLGRALFFDGTDDHVQLSGKMTPYDAALGRFSISAWAFALSRPSWANIIANWGDNIYGMFHFGLTELSGELCCRLAQADNTYTGLAIINTLFPLNEWVHCCAIADGSTLSVWQNCIRGNTTVNYNGTLKTNNPFAIGSKFTDNSITPVYLWHGYITNITLWRRSLSRSEIHELYADPWAMYRVRPRVLVRGVTLKKTPIHHLMVGCT